MDIFSFLREHGSPPSPTDEILYEFVAGELANSMVKQGLWTKALSDAEWNESKAKSLYVKMRIAQLRSELLAHVAQQQALLSDPANEARAFGLSEEDIEYLRKPIKAIRYVEKYRVSKDKLSKAIGLGKIRGVLCGDVLWVQDREIS
ncbi:MAG: hypothetical protein PHX60_06780 [Giesbergeria sp.]|uniref:hypothetical protein n=1 Tax=Giesbergeria sp. TaxID=2818473 RepID=UPI00260EE5E2|nr:hypothetical protein [Giesbergeria sp.]MDD2609389.1 hypothetical protein [Giesbergeria sp.]